MTNEEKELLLKDLCARLPYGVKIYGNYRYSNGDDIVDNKKIKVLDLSALDWFVNGIYIKPYLRPMSSMTNDERFEYLDFLKVEIQDGGWVSENYVVRLADMPMLIDWLNAHHFDYRDLIKMGLALEAPEGMYNFK